MQPVLFSVSYAGLWGQAQLSLEEFIPHAAELGYPAVELTAKRPHLSPLDYPLRRVRELRALCEKSEVEVACVAAYTDFCGGADAAEVPFVEMQIAYIETLSRLAEELGCHLVRVFTGYERPGMTPDQAWNRTCDALREACARAETFGVTLGIQNHHDVAVHSRALLELLQDIDCPNCRLMLDPWSPALRGEDLYQTACELAPHVVYTTLADYVRLPRFHYEPNLVNYRRVEPDLARAVPMGEGDIDSASFLRGLQEGGYDGPVAYEMCSPLRGGGSMSHLDACATRFLQWCRTKDFI
jgi:sugar phosphate isomerase/epimerase